MPQKIILKKLVAENIVNRQSIDLIRDKIDTSDRKVVLNFKNISFISRSFADELIKLCNKSNYIVEFSNLNKETEKMIDSAKKQKRTFNKTNMLNVKNINNKIYQF